MRIAKADLVPDRRPTCAPSTTRSPTLASGVRGVLRDGQRPGAPGDRRSPGRGGSLTERERLHALPISPYTAALGETRLVNDRPDRPVRVGALLHPTGHGRPARCGCRVDRRGAGHRRRPERPTTDTDADTDTGLVEVARHRLSTPGNPRIDLAHYPDHPQTADGAPRPPKPRAAQPRPRRRSWRSAPGAHAWLVEAAAAGAQRVRAKMAAAVELAALVGAGPVDEALGIAAAAGRFAEGDLARHPGPPRRRCTGSHARGRRRDPLRPTRHRHLGTFGTTDGTTGEVTS